jgi:tol-pal system protein YbgF
VTSFSAFAESSQSLEQRIQHLEELSQTRNKVQADTSYQLSELQREVRLLTGQVEDNNFKLKQIQDRQRDLYRDIESRLSGLSSQPAGSSKKSSKPVVNKSTPAANNNGKVRRKFEAAFALVRNKDYKAAINAFSAFLTQYPASSYSANAHFWMGQVYLVQGNLNDAERQFTLLVSQFPDSSKVAAAKLKLGDIFVKQKKWADAKSYYSDVANNVTGAQGQLARKGLDKIKKAGH